MSKIIASAAIRGAHKIVARAEKKWQEAMEKWQPNEEVGFPNTAYYLPVIYGILGIKVEKLADMEPVLKRCKSLLPPLVKETHPNWSPGAVKAAVQRSAQQLECPPDWQPLGPGDERERCYGKNGRTSFFGHGLVDAAAAAQQ